MRLIIYGVFDGAKCLMVGSTSKSLETRAKQYKKYKWFKDEYGHKTLWEGDLDCEIDHLRFWRAVKEALFISKMNTWYDQGGRNKSNPIIQMMGMSLSYEQVGKAFGHLGGKVGGVTAARVQMERKIAIFAPGAARRGALAQSREAKVRGGSTQGLKNAQSGYMAKLGHEQGLRNVETGHVARAAHQRWHVNRGIKKIGCKFCDEVTK
jgi:hypothetical protein